MGHISFSSILITLINCVKIYLNELPTNKSTDNTWNSNMELGLHVNTQNTM
jgi:hypothetical protein